MMVREEAIDTVRRWRRDVTTAADADAAWDQIENEVAELLYDLEEAHEVVEW